MRHKLIYLIFALMAYTGAVAQHLPERGLVRKGNKLFNKGEYAESVTRYDEALRHAPTSFEAGYNLSNALYKGEKYEEAEKRMTQVLADTLLSDADRAEAFYNLGNSQFQQKKYKEALQSYRQSLLCNPSDQEAKYNYAYTKRLLDDQQQNGGGGNNDQQQQDKDQQNQNGQDQQKEGQNKDKEQQQGDKDQQQQKGDQQPQKQNPDEGNQPPKEEQQGEGQPAEAGISPQEQQQMLDAIQAQEDKTQDKLKEKRKGILIPSKKNW